MSTEARARLKINKLLENAGWRFFDSSDGRANISVEQVTDFDSLGDDFEGSKGFIDYLLLDNQGFPLAVLEAKSEKKNPLIGKEQALEYAKSKNCNYVILSNGELSYLWDIRKSSEELIINFPNQKQLKGFIAKENPIKLTQIEILEDWIVKSQGKVSDSEKRFLRDYQLDAIAHVARNYDDGKDRFLLEMATGTGKTLLASALIKLFLKSNSAKRVLFIVDTIELAIQAQENISSYLKEYNVVIFKNDKESALQNQVVVATIQSLSTNQNYLRYFNDFDFDLIFSDEAHRSITGLKSRAIFEYFKSIKIGLTATPKDFLKGIDPKKLGENDPRNLERRLLMDTYRTFGCEAGSPTFRFDLQAAVNHEPPYLVNPIVFDKRSDKTNQMLMADGWADTFIDSVTGIETEENFKVRDFERKVFSESLNRLMCEELVRTSKLDPISGEIGKSIVYCISQNHAAKITHLLNEIADQKFPGKYNGLSGTFARQVTSSVQESQELSKKFRLNQLGTTRVVVTVRMMTTGYDCPDLLNVVLMKPIFSVSEFIQMKGRGTRLNVFKDPLRKTQIDKDNFYLIDFFGVCEYFEQEYDYSEPLKLGTPKDKENEPYDVTTGNINTPISVIHGDFIYIGDDFLVIDNTLQIGKNCMKVDREAYKDSFEETIRNLVKDIPEFSSALNENNDAKIEQFALENILGKPDYYFDLASLRNVYQSGADLVDLIKIASGYIKKLPDKFESLRREFQEYRMAHPNMNFEKNSYLQNIFDCYFTNKEYRDSLNDGDYSVIENQSLGGNVPIRALTKTELMELFQFMKGLRQQDVYKA